MRRIALFVFTCYAALYAGDTFTRRQREFWCFQKVRAEVSMAGGGIRQGQMIGRTDDIGLRAVERPTIVSGEVIREALA
jgi:hypothetical protein